MNGLPSWIDPLTVLKLLDGDAQDFGCRNAVGLERAISVMQDHSSFT